MNLALDIGNTVVKVGVFEGSALVEKHFFDTVDHERLGSLVHTWQVTHAIICSVREDEEIELPVTGQTLTLTEQTPVPLEVRYLTPETLGKDRLAAVVGGHSVFPGSDVLIIDAGTCITYDFVDAQGVFQGGNIAPGLDMRFRAMHEFTAHLPRVERGDTRSIMGLSTTEAMQNGVDVGMLLEIGGYIEYFKAKHASLKIVLTGGDASYFADKFKTEIFVRPDLVLIGLNEILLSNVATLH